MKSSNKTYLNGKPVEKARIRSGDRLHIVDFDIEVDLGGDTPSEQPVEGFETLEPSGPKMYHAGRRRDGRKL